MSDPKQYVASRLVAFWSDGSLSLFNMSWAFAEYWHPKASATDRIVRVKGFVLE